MVTLKISLIVLILVIISTSNAHHGKPHTYQDRMRYQMCHNRLKYHHVYHVNYQSDVKKCFVAGKKELTWEEAKSACSKLPRIRGFGRPTLARIDLNYDQYTNLIKDMNLDSCTTYYSHWTGAHIPAEYAKNNYSKWNEQWRWISDNSPLRNDYHAWALKNNQPAKKPHGFCAYYDCWDVRGMYNAPCDQKHRMLCQYKVKEPYDIHHSDECIWPKAHPNSYMHAPLTQLRFRDGTVVAVVRCDPGHVIKNDPEKRTYQTVICEHGQWPNTAMTCVKDDK